MLKKSILIVAFIFIFVLVGIADEITPPPYMEIPTTERHVTQIKWAYNQGYIWGILAYYNYFRPSPNPINFVLPVIKTAWEMGYTDAIIELQRIETERDTKE